MLDKTEKVILAIILLVGAALRIYNYWDFSLSNDELSALARLDFDSFTDLIMNGVRIDGHPAAAQVILWYVTNWFGNSVAVVRLPFVFAGILSVYFMFRLGKEWISTSAGLLSAATFAALAFPILYSRIARPYALGMLFALMAATFWIRIVKGNQKPSDFVWLAISLALCAYSHYFAALVASILAFTGTFLITGRNLKLYLFALAAAFILYFPYIPIFLHQLSLGGVGQWLGPPENDWLWQHVDHVFNDSLFVLITVTVASVIGFAASRPSKSFIRNGLPLLLFSLPFLVGFAYSKWVNPVLQHSTLLFSFPFFLIFLFSGWNDGKRLLTNVTALGLLIITVGSTTVQNKFYQSNHFGVFKELAEHITEWNNEVHGEALLVGDFNYPFYLHYYLDKLGTDSLSLYRTSDETGLAELKSLVDTTTKNDVIYAWSTVNQIPEIEDVIRAKFPIEVNRVTYFNSEVVQFTPGMESASVVSFDFEKNDTWNLNPDAIRMDSTGAMSIVMNAENQFGPTYTAKLSELRSKKIQSVIVKITCSQLMEGSAVQMVYEQANEDERYVWESDEFKRQFKAGGPNWGIFHYDLKDALNENDSSILKVYPWSPDGEQITIQKMEVILR